ncbi:hypothetical protein LINPERHAP2_LOCUS31746 [Linum perenne]
MLNSCVVCEVLFSDNTFVCFGCDFCFPKCTILKLNRDKVFV